MTFNKSQPTNTIFWTCWSEQLFPETSAKLTDSIETYNLPLRLLSPTMSQNILHYFVAWDNLANCHHWPCVFQRPNNVTFVLTNYNKREVEYLEWNYIFHLSLFEGLLVKSNKSPTVEGDQDSAETLSNLMLNYAITHYLLRGNTFQPKHVDGVALQ